MAKKKCLQYEKVKQPISNIIQGRASICTYLNVKRFKSMNHIVSLKADSRIKIKLRL